MFEQRGAVSRPRRDGLPSSDTDGVWQVTGKEQDAHEDQETIRVHGTVSGRVQGVGYRYFAVTAASRLGVTGWVRNLINGDVELEAQASRPVVHEFLATMKSGNEWSRVQSVEVMAVPVNPAERNFTVIR